MTTRQKRLKDQALEWWYLVPPDQQKRLRAELAAYPQGTRLIEINQPDNFFDGSGYHARARCVSVGFGTTLHRECRYLGLADLPRENEEARPRFNRGRASSLFYSAWSTAMRCLMSSI